MGRLFYGWWIVAAVIVLSLYAAGSVFWSFSFLTTPVRHDLGWSGSDVAAAYAIQGVAALLLAPLIGVLFDRFGPRWLNIVGSFLSALGMLLLSQMDSLWQFYLGFTLAAMELNMVIGAGYAAVANWFVRRRGLAIGIASLGIAGAGTIASVVVWLVEAFGWRQSYIILGVTFLVLCIPLAWTLRRRPEDYGLAPDGDIRKPVRAGEMMTPLVHAGDAAEVSLGRAARGRAFWLIGLGFTMGFWTIGSVQVHNASFLGGVGISTGVAAAMITGLSLSTIPGRVAFGWLADKADLRTLTIVALVLAAIGTAVFSFVSANQRWVLLLFLATYGPALGGLMVLQPVMQGRYFGRLSFGAISGVYASLATVTWSGGPFILSLLLAFTTYPAGFLLFAGFTALGIPLLVLLKPPRTDSAASLPLTAKEVPASAS